MNKVLGGTSLLLALLLAGCGEPAVYAPAPPPPPPVIDFRAIGEQGFHDGFEAARHDVETGQPPRFDHHPRWRNPPVPPPGVDAYRHGFQDGYSRYLHTAPPPPGPAY